MRQKSLECHSQNQNFFLSIEIVHQTITIIIFIIIVSYFYLEFIYVDSDKMYSLWWAVENGNNK